MQPEPGLSDVATVSLSTPHQLLDTGEEPDEMAKEAMAAAEEAVKEAQIAAQEKKEADEAHQNEQAKNKLSGTTSLAMAAAEMATAATGKAVTGWQYDKNSGYYYDTQAQLYYDPATQAYFDCQTNKWTQSAKPTASQLASGVNAGSFKSGTRKADRFGL